MNDKEGKTQQRSRNRISCIPFEMVRPIKAERARPVDVCIFDDAHAAHIQRSFIGVQHKRRTCRIRFKRAEWRSNWTNLDRINSGVFFFCSHEVQNLHCGVDEIWFGFILYRNLKLESTCNAMQFN